MGVRTCKAENKEKRSKLLAVEVQVANVSTLSIEVSDQIYSSIGTEKRSSDAIKASERCIEGRQCTTKAERWLGGTQDAAQRLRGQKG